MPTIDTSKWVITDAPPPPKRRPEVQIAYDFFWNLPLGSSALIPKDEASTARNAAGQLKKESDGNVEIRFREENETQIRATKSKDYTPEDKAKIVAEGYPDPVEAAAEAAPATA
jgi:hypothetical protein